MMEVQGVDPESEVWINNSGWSYIVTAECTSMGQITCAHFDNVEDRLWTGNEMGRVVSYHSTMVRRHTAFVQPGPIRAIETFEGGVLSLTPNILRAQTRSGLSLFSYSSDKMRGMLTMHQPLESAGHVYVGGETQNLLHFDVETQRELRMAKIQQKDVCVIRTNGKSVLTADTEGNIGVRDLNSLDNVRVIPCHLGGPVIDFDVVGNQLITCGASSRAGTLHGDPYVKVYDLRNFRAQPPIPLSFSPCFARFLPSYSVGKVILVSQMCQVQLHDLNDHSGIPFLIDPAGAPLTAFAIAPSRQVIAFGDAAGNTHLYVDRDDAVLNENEALIEIADHIVLPHQSFFGIDDTSHCLSSIPLPFSYDDAYLSDWPEENCEYAYRKPRPLPEYSAIRMQQHVQHASNPRTGTPLARFNVCPYDLEKSEIKEDTASRDSDGVQTEEEGEITVAVPRYYRPCLWKQPIKGGDETASLSRFNRTSRVPIEYNNGANFANPLIQVLYSIPSLRNIFLHHLCHSDECLTCQLGFIFRMISDREAVQPASSNNLMRSLRASSFCALSSTISAAEKVQQLLHYIFEDATKHLSAPDFSHLSSLSSFSLTTNTRCIRCSSVNSESTEIPVLKINYPAGEPLFCTLLEKSLNGRRSKQDECRECATTTRIEETLRVRSLSPLLIFDTNPTAANYGLFWKTMLTKWERRPKYANPPQEAEKSERVCRWGEDCRNRSSCKYVHGSAADWEEECKRWMEEGQGTWSHYVPNRFYARISGGIAALQEHEPDSNDTTESHAYDLVAVVCVVSDDASHQSWKYVVAECLEEWSAEGTHHNDAGAKQTWLIINGIAICRVSTDEALHLDHRWKMPLVFIYAKRKSLVMTATESRVSIPFEVFERDSSLTGNDDLVRERRLASLPKKEEIVGIDAEFISMSKDGTKKCVGRVSVVDSTGELIIMDDYIAGVDGDIVHDYLTQYSGIMEHDLCRVRSKKHLTTLKAAYIKLLHLVETGVVFVGHALFNDFSMLNIHVPPDQIRDTVQLFRLPQQRLISLQFLAFHLLDLKIQESSHDSVEDARVSLQLFRKWQQLQQAGTLDTTIRWLYEQGKVTNWRLSAGSPALTLEPFPRDSLPTTPTKSGTPSKDDSLASDQ
ncbi:hypothetical protein PFISCL1PPCAC_10646 [Pristionchus fissidentatus]|uniref:USP domain-containing protein n=1 Tax=Pristionchus fissidentatus TaxID=1538716 RepID=A0AAV5VLT6_9BILA|nr:hypothetical protein PFISCL1PPCAC_10646 [Pristionchus fissidentatus]